MKYKMPKQTTKSVTTYGLETMTLSGINTYLCCNKQNKK